MSKQCFKEFNFRGVTLQTINTANEIIEDYLSQGYRMTLRQLYYQFVSRNLITNEEKSYKKLASTISDGRLAGLIDWEAIEDRGRQPWSPGQFDGLPDLVDAALRSYKLPRWKGQEHYAELWVEKQALAGVLQPLADKFHVTLMVNKGYSSQSAMWESAQRFKANKYRNLHLFYLGDHDPSGEDMVRDIRDRMEMFRVYDLDVQKLALTMAQIRQYKPPPNPAKVSDSRAAKYIAEFGDSSWEVDALPPNVLGKIITDAFEDIIDRDLFDGMKDQEEVDKKRLRQALEAIS